MMGGRAWATSELGRGSKFHVELPLPVRPSKAAAPASALTADWATDLPALDVLVAEDNPVNQKVILAMLRRLGWTVTLAANGREAFDQFTRRRFSLVLMDIQMPELDGFEATSLIRRHERENDLARTPVIALTAHTGNLRHEQCLSGDMDGVITKPVTPQTLIRGTSAVLGREPQAAGCVSPA